MLCVMLWMGTPDPAESGQPNILFIFTDDQAPELVGAWNPEIHTPHLDGLAERGTTFSHTFNQGSWTPAVCVASRTMLVTGAQLWHGAAYCSRRNNRDHNSPRDMPEYRIGERPRPDLWPVLMRQAGYETYFTGKWHVEGPPHEQFDHVRHPRGGMPAQTEIRYQRTFAEDEPDTWSPYDKELGGYWAGGTHWSEVTADDAIGFLNHARNLDKPFFMYIAFNAPHDPWQSPKEFVDLYPVEDMSLPPNFLPEYPYNEEIGSGRWLRDERLGPYPRTEHAVRVSRAEYYAITSHLDREIGRILEALERTGQAENTYILFTSDHGLAVGQHGLFGKQNMYDHSMRVPMIIAGPGIPAGKTVDAMVYLQDVMPTSLELAGIPIPEHVNFKSLLPLAQGETTESPYQAMYGAYFSAQRMIRTDDYKMMIYPSINRVRLYDMKNDPWEKHDLAHDPQYRPVMDDLLEIFRHVQAEVADPMDMTEYYEAFFEKLTGTQK